MHESTHGSFDAFRTTVAQATASVDVPAPLQNEAPTVASSEGLVDTAMGHIDAMKFRYRHTDAEVKRAKTLVQACLAEVKPALGGGSGDGELHSLLDPLIGAFDRISSSAPARAWSAPCLKRQAEVQGRRRGVRLRCLP